MLVGSIKQQKVKSENRTGTSDNGRPYSTFIEYDTNGIVSYYKEIWNKKTIHEYRLIRYDHFKNLAKYHFMVFYEKTKNAPDTVDVTIAENSLKSVYINKPRLNIIEEKWRRTMSQHKNFDTIKYNQSLILLEKVVGAGFDKYEHYFITDSIKDFTRTTYIKKSNDASNWFDFFTIESKSFKNKKEITDFTAHTSDEGVFVGYLVSSKEIEYDLDDGCLVKEYQSFWNDNKHLDKPIITSKHVFGQGFEEDFYYDKVSKTSSHSKFEKTYYK